MIDITRLLAQLGAVVLLVIFLAACNAGSGSVKLPSGWPMPDLAPPPGSTKAKTVRGEGYDSEDGGFTGKTQLDSGAPMTIWVVGFKNSGGWGKVANHVDGILLAIGFKVDTESDLQPTHLKKYMSADESTMVDLMYWKQRKTFDLIISVWQ